MLPELAGQTVTASFAGLRPATEHRDYVLNVDAGSGWITVGGIRSTGLSAALGLGEWAAGAGSAAARRRAAGAAGRRSRLAADAQPRAVGAASLPAAPAARPIVCHCEWVTEREVDGRAGGRCAGGHARRAEAPDAGDDGPLPGLRLRRRGGARSRRTLARPRRKPSNDRRAGRADRRRRARRPCRRRGAGQRGITGRTGGRARARGGRHPALLPASDVRPHRRSSADVRAGLCSAAGERGAIGADSASARPSPPSAPTSPSRSPDADGETQCRPERILLATGIRETPRVRAAGLRRPAAERADDRRAAAAGRTRGSACHSGGRSSSARELVSFSAVLTLRDAGVRPVAMIEEAAPDRGPPAGRPRRRG